MAYYSDSAYQLEARRAVIDLGCYFTARLRLRRALDLGRGAPGRWFEGALPNPHALARIQRFLLLAGQVDELSQNQIATGRFFAQLHYSGHALDDPERESEILDKARVYFHAGVPPLPARSQWRQTLLEKHPDLLAMPPGKKERVEPEPEALAELLGELVEA